MVGTRKSLPNAAPDAPISDTANVPKELRRLHIDGKDTMRGSKLATQEEQEVYHWRGIAYAIEEDTPQEWLDQDPKYRKRKAEQDAAMARAAAAKASSSKSTSNSLKRKSTSALGTSTGEGEEEDDDTVRPAKRARRHTTNFLPAPTTIRQRRSTTTTPSNMPRRTSARATRATEDDTESAFKFEHSTARHLEIKADIATKKEAAREKGFKVAQYSDNEWDEMLQRKQSQPRTSGSLGAKLGLDMIKMAKLNSEIARIKEEYEEAKRNGIYKAIMAAKAKARQIARDQEGDDEDDEIASAAQVQIPRISVEDEFAGEDIRLADAVENVFDERDTQSQVESQVHEELNDDDSDTVDPLSLPATMRPSRRMRRESSVSEERSSKRQDSATTATSPDQVPSSNTSIEAVESLPVKRSPRKALRTLARENKGGQKLRWSLSDEAPSNSNSDSKPKPRGVDRQARYSHTDRAEELIHKGRLNGESKSARRRRIQREMKILESWPIDNEESAKLKAKAKAKKA